MHEFVERCLAASRESQPYPLLSAHYPDADIAAAYQLQQSFVTLLGLSTVGYKAALTAPPAQQSMGLNEPVVGVLLETAPRQPDTAINIPPNGVLETELGYTLNSAIQTQVRPENVLDFVASVSPMVELAHPNLAARPRGGDLIATNSAAFAYLQGHALEPHNVALDDIQTRLNKAEETLFGGRCNEVMNGQLDALCWLINSVQELGYPLASGHVLMTGSVGGVAPSLSGRYSAHFSLADQVIETIEFELTDT